MIGTPQAPHDAMDFWLPVAVVFASNTVFFLFCQFKADNAYIDVFWGMLFVFPLIALAIKDSVQYQTKDDSELDDSNHLLVNNWRFILVLLCESIWCFRLSMHILRRHTVEDFRFLKLREDFGKNGKCCMYINFFFKIFMAQAFSAILCNCPALYIAIYSYEMKLIWMDYLGLAVFLIGFAIEIIADEQLRFFLRDMNPDKGKFCKRGLWRYSRHPNYFGEAVLWWGIYLMACSIKWGWTSFFSPVVISLLVRYATGVPMLEEKYKDNEEFK